MVYLFAAHLTRACAVAVSFCKDTTFTSFPAIITGKVHSINRLQSLP